MITGESLVRRRPIIRSSPQDETGLAVKPNQGRTRYHAFLACLIFAPIKFLLWVGRVSD